MRKKKLITFLGIGNYYKAEHLYQGTTKGEYSFIQNALIDLSVVDYDEIYLILTDEAKRENLDKLLMEGENNLIYIDINDDISVNELFVKVNELIDQDDQIDFDITHSFRSIPLIAISVVNYAKTIKNADVNHIWYGEYNRDTKKTMIQDYKEMVKIQEWTSAIESYLKTGNAQMMQELSVEERRERGKAKDFDGLKIFDSLKDIAESLNNLYQSISACRSNSINKDNIIHHLNKIEKNLDKFYGKVKDMDFVHPLVNLLEKVEDTIQQLEGNNEEEILFNTVYHHCLEFGLVQQGYTLLQETFVTYLYKMIKPENANNSNAHLKRDERKQINGSLTYLFAEERGIKHKFKPVDLTEELNAFIKTTENKIKNNSDKDQINILSTFDELTQARNDLNHAGMNNSPQTTQKLEAKLAEFSETINLFVNTAGYNY